ncbi:MAG: hypothetical protein GEU88_15410 [Solirubrobacterales bacterium]|nr:hypothetical protein [Solirubrobacterales bacterium]
MHERRDQAGDRDPVGGAEARDRAARGRPTVDEMSEWSFPASDPPPAWSWEVQDPLPPAGADADAGRDVPGERADG